MTAADAQVTLTINENTKAFSLSDKIALYEQLVINIVTASGNTWPAGSYTLAVTYYGRTMALSACDYDDGALTCSITFATEELEALFSLLRNPKRVQLDLTLWDNSAKKKWATGKVDVWFTEYSTASATPVPVTSTYYNGSTSIAAGATSATVDISTYSLTAAPSQIFVSVKVPSGQDNIFVVSHNATSTAITVQLNGPTSASGCVLNWLFFP